MTMISEQKEEPDPLHCEIDVDGRDWVLQGDPGKAEGVANWVDSLIKKFGGSGQVTVHVDMTDPCYKSWTFKIPEEAYPQVEEKLDEKESEFS